MAVAVVHDWLPVFSGAEQVVASIMRTVGPSDLYTLYNFLGKDDIARLGAKEIFTSYLDRLPLREKYYRYTFPFCPMAIESFDLSAYDLIISSSAAFAKGVIVHPHQHHIAYVHTPVRYAWDQTYEYMRQTRVSRGLLGSVLRKALYDLRMWDSRTSSGPDLYLANSMAVRRRIRQVYGRDADVIHPPVDVNSFGYVEEKDDYYVTACRLVPYKRVDLMIDAFRRMPNKKLIVCGSGPDFNRLKADLPPNVELKGHVSRADLIRYVQQAKAFLYSAYEDFGIVMAEAQSAGTPVIAFERGGAADIVTPIDQIRPTGVLFKEQKVESVMDAVALFEREGGRISAENCRAKALQFSPEQFTLKLNAAIDKVQDQAYDRDLTSRTTSQNTLRPLLVG